MATTLRPFAGAEHEPYFLEGSVETAALLVHGFPGTPVELRTVGGMLHAAGLSVEGMLLPGFGRDFGNVANYSTEEWLAAVLARLDALQGRFAQVLLVGNSMGAALAMLAAAQRSVDGVLLFAPWWRIKQRRLDALFPLLAPLIPRLHIGAAAPGVAAPTLIVQGVRDILVHPSVTSELVQLMPNLVGIALANGDHELAHMAHADERALEPLIAHFAHMVAQNAWRMP
jgi:pimeloyl-ACP methyl ester carboxylesterase